MKVIATCTISFQTGFDSSATENIHGLFDPQATLADVLEWAKQHKHCLYCSDVTISTPIEPTTKEPT